VKVRDRNKEGGGGRFTSSAQPTRLYRCARNASWSKMIILDVYLI